MDRIACEKIVREIHTAWRTGCLLELPTLRYGGMSLQDAYVVQDALSGALATDFGPVVGYKAAFLDDASQKKYGITAPVTGRLFRSQKVENGGSVRFDRYRLFHVEAEIALVMDRRIEQRIEDVETLMPCVRSVHVGLDAADNRFVPSVREQNIADFVAGGAGARHFVVGPALPAAVDFPRNASLEIIHDGATVYEGPAAGPAGGPFQVARWMVNHLFDRGYFLEAGQVLLTGKVAPPFKPRGREALGMYGGRYAGRDSVCCRVV